MVYRAACRQSVLDDKVRGAGNHGACRIPCARSWPSVSARGPFRLRATLARLFGAACIHTCALSCSEDICSRAILELSPEAKDCLLKVCWPASICRSTTSVVVPLRPRSRLLAVQALALNLVHPSRVLEVSPGFKSFWKSRVR